MSGSILLEDYLKDSHLDCSSDWAGTTTTRVRGIRIQRVKVKNWWIEPPYIRY